MAESTKLLFIGHSGAGKTGALVSLIEAGFNLRILDMENKTHIIRNILRDNKKSHLWEKLVSCQVVTDGAKIIGAQMIPTATAWPTMLKTLGNWPALGNIGTWNENDILVLDSGTAAGKAATRFLLNLNGRISDLPGWSDYLAAQDLMDKLCATICSSEVKCNVIVISHIREVAKTRQEVDSKGRQITIEEEGTRKGFAETGTGKAFSPIIGRYFNSVLLADTEGSGQSARHVIRTKTHDNIPLKNPAPGSVKPSYPLATGLAEFFATVRGEPNPGTDK